MATRNTFRFGWNPRAARYVDLTSGRFISQQFIVETVEKRIALGQERVSDLLHGAIARNNSLAQWEEAMARELKRAHVENYALGKGGWNRMTQADYGRVGRTLRDEYAYLRNFAQNVRDGKLSMVQIEARSKLYENKIRASYWNGQTSAMRAAGMTQKRRVLHPAEHCEDCVGQAGLDWVAMDDRRVTVPADGSTICKTNCKCTLEYR